MCIDKSASEEKEQTEVTKMQNILPSFLDNHSHWCAITKLSINPLTPMLKKYILPIFNV